MSHTTHMPGSFASPESSTVPFYPQKGNPQYRILVKPDVIPEQITEAGLVLPEDSTKICETGIVVSSHEDSQIMVGDKVWYAIIERGENAVSAKVYIGGELHHLLLETEVWAANEFPINRLYVKPLPNVSDKDVSLHIPNSAPGLQRGEVVSAPLNSTYFRKGQEVVYRRNNAIKFPEVMVEDDLCHIIFEREVYTVDGSVSPYRMIVKIDKREQDKMKVASGTNLRVHSLFQYMRHYLQWGRVIEMGKEAQKMYPWIFPNNYIALLHTVEHSEHRLLHVRKNKKGDVTSEFRILNCFDKTSREILGMMVVERENTLSSNLKVRDIVPSEGNLFLNWKFSPFEKIAETRDLVGAHRLDLSKVTDLEDLIYRIEIEKKKGFDAYMADFNKSKSSLERLDPSNPEDRKHIAALETRIEDLKRTAERSAKPITKNHMLICRIEGGIYAKDPGNSTNYQYVLTYTNQLYPISLMGEKYMVVNENFIIAFLNIKNTQSEVMVTEFIPFADRVLVKPDASEKTEEGSSLVIPGSASFESAVTGTVIAVGPGTDKVTMIVSPGEEIMYHRLGAEEITLEGEKYLLMKQNDLLMKITKSE